MSFCVALAGALQVTGPVAVFDLGSVRSDKLPACRAPGEVELGLGGETGVSRSWNG
jgi:hypothetical protein